MVDIILNLVQVVKNFFRIGRQDNANEFRGAAHDLSMSRIIFPNCPKLSCIILPQPRTDYYFYFYAELPQKVLDIVAILLYKRRRLGFE